MPCADNDDPVRPQFGQHLEGVSHIPRVGVYAVVIGDQDVGTVRTSHGHFLPGGGTEAGESVEATLRREVREECGYAIDLGQWLGAAIEWFLAEREHVYYRLHSVYFAVTLSAKLY